MADPKMTPHTQTVLRVLMGQDAGGERRSAVLTTGLYGLELSKMTDLPNGTLFPLLERLRQAGWVERYWEQDDIAEEEGRPRRRFFRLTRKGAEAAPLALAVATAAAPSSGRTASRPGLVGGHL
ncbi:helix-turn-helix transcriptional regulator (plasmid) [Streptomyces sp. BH-SS-21]|uniref:Helix-turn-helix transcriptional regulator n=1 Tax=Streptomyces liliiviolaceus TaxID=2823109 RepID=A0A940Y5L5_9ACTN|nr:helix-turn-helix transcriptional regulator [Streptomyces liliiviolaceus]MBQ0855650.1 helix-turn-helix transcriptional regulator [Streptomyces liliiviolaceus]